MDKEVIVMREWLEYIVNRIAVTLTVYGCILGVLQLWRVSP